MTNAGYILRTKYESFIWPFEQTLFAEFPVENIPQDSRQMMQGPNSNWIQSTAESQRQ